MVEWIVRIPGWLALLIIGALLLLIGWLDWITSWEWSLFVLYAVPIFMAVLLSGQRAGLIMAVLCALVWWLANESSSPYQTRLGYSLAMASRLVYFGISAFAFASIKKRQETDAERIKMLEERRQLEMDIVRVSEHEQQRIGQDLHDGLCQQLAAIGCAVRALADDLRDEAQPSAVRDLELVEDMLRSSVSEARSLARGIFPVHVDQLGLASALSEMAAVTMKLTGTPVRVEESGQSRRLAPQTAMHLYRIAQEAVANAVRHSGASQVEIRLEALPEGLRLAVRDNGRGISGSATGKLSGMGLRTMRYRAQALGTELEVKPLPEGGTCVSCCLPAV